MTLTARACRVRSLSLRCVLLGLLFPLNLAEAFVRLGPSRRIFFMLVDLTLAGMRGSLT